MVEPPFVASEAHGNNDDDRDENECGDDSPEDADEAVEVDPGATRGGGILREGGARFQVVVIVRGVWNSRGKFSILSGIWNMRNSNLKV